MTTTKLLKWVWLSVLLNLLYSTLVRADLPYEGPSPQANAIQTDNQRVPAVGIITDPITGSILLKETDYTGEGQFPLSFVRYFTSPNNYPCVQSDWAHNYSSCIVTHFDRWYVQYRTASVCSMGACTTFEYDQTKPDPKYGYKLKPRFANVHDTLERDVTFNGKLFSFGYTQFKTGIKEGYDSNGRLLSRFDRSGIEHKLMYNASNSLKSVTHVPSGRLLQFQYAADSTLSTVTDPKGTVYTYDWFNAYPYASTVTYPPAKTGDTALVRRYEFIKFWCSGEESPLPFLTKITESNQLQMETLFVEKGDKSCVLSDFVGYIFFSQLTLAGHNAKPLIYVSEPTPSWYFNGLDIPMTPPYLRTEDKLTLKFADSDNADYRSLSTIRKYINTNNGYVGYNERYEWMNYSIPRSSSVSIRCADCLGDYKNYTYDPTTGDLLTRTDYLGRITQFVNDGNGLPITEIQAKSTPEARTITRTWDSRFPLKTSEKIGNIIHEWRYNGQGHAIKDIVH
ncbi:MAG: DUF6531 domain-containing protein, partial [Methylovulum sp.]|nr:DUF6531 domain-containing protein [Methylovulum sp.]